MSLIITNPEQEKQNREMVIFILRSKTIEHTSIWPEFQKKMLATNHPKATRRRGAVALEVYNSIENRTYYEASDLAEVMNKWFDDQGVPRPPEAAINHMLQQHHDRARKAGVKL